MKYFKVLTCSITPILFIISTLFTGNVFSETTVRDSIFAIAEREKQGSAISVPIAERTPKLVKRTKLEHAGYYLAKRGLYDQALEKYKQAMDPSLIVYKGDAAYALCGIGDIFKYQGKLNDALELTEKYILPRNPEKEEYIERRLELIAMIEARDNNSKKPVYDYINYLKVKYKKFLPPEGYAVPYSSKIDDIIYLYDYLHDYDSGIEFLNVIIKYHTEHKNPNHRSANKRYVQDYERVKRAWQLDKETGKHGHLQDVIRTSDVIGW